MLQHLKGILIVKALMKDCNKEAAKLCWVSCTYSQWMKSRENAWLKQQQCLSIVYSSMLYFVSPSIFPCLGFPDAFAFGKYLESSKDPSGNTDLLLCRRSYWLCLQKTTQKTMNGSASSCLLITSLSSLCGFCLWHSENASAPPATDHKRGPAR